MKVLHIISSPAAGGAEMYVKNLSIAMAEKVMTFLFYL